VTWRGDFAGGYDEAIRYRLRTLLIVASDANFGPSPHSENVN
jgi:hypothetical protein